MSDFSDCLEHFIREGKIDTQLLADRVGLIPLNQAVFVASVVGG